MDNIQRMTNVRKKEKIADFQQIVGRGWEHIRLFYSSYSGTDSEYRVRWYAFIKIECDQNIIIEPYN